MANKLILHVLNRYIKVETSVYFPYNNVYSALGWKIYIQNNNYNYHLIYMTSKLVPYIILKPGMNVPVQFSYMTFIYGRLHWLIINACVASVMSLA